MGRVIYVPDPAGTALVTRSPVGLVGNHLRKLGRRLEKLAKADVGKKTGALARSINSKVELRATGLVVVIGSSNRIALLHHEGSRRHIILPKTAKALRFMMRGRLVVTKRVNHPGTRPNPYLTKNLAAVVLTG